MDTYFKRFLSIIGLSYGFYSICIIVSFVFFRHKSIFTINEFYNDPYIQMSALSSLYTIVFPLLPIFILIPFYKLIYKIINNTWKKITKTIFLSLLLPFTLPMALYISERIETNCDPFNAADFAPLYLFLIIFPITLLTMLFVKQKYIKFKKEFCLFLYMNTFWLLTPAFIFFMFIFCSNPIEVCSHIVLKDIVVYTISFIIPVVTVIYILKQYKTEIKLLNTINNSQT